MTSTIPPELADAIGGKITDPSLFIEALTHGSHSAAAQQHGDYQRLEFLGDRVLGLVCAEALFAQHRDAQEGELSHRLNGLVSRATCAEVARAIGLGQHIRLGKQARDDGARDSDNVLGDVIEAIIGAIFIDSGIDDARRFVLRHWAARFEETPAQARHPKSVLQEWAAQHRHKPPTYHVTRRDGPDHASQFTVCVSVNKVGEASASGTSKQDAEKNAAMALITQLGIAP